MPQSNWYKNYFCAFQVLRKQVYFFETVTTVFCDINT